MDEEQVDVVLLEGVERAVERLQRIVALVEAVVQLRGDEDVAAVESALGDGLADARLVAVHLGGVDVAVADLEGGERRVLRLGRVDLVDAESELGIWMPLFRVMVGIVVM